MTRSREQGSAHYLGLTVRGPLPSPPPCARLWGLLRLSTPFLLSEVPMAGEGALGLSGVEDPVRVGVLCLTVTSQPDSLPLSLIFPLKAEFAVN